MKVPRTLTQLFLDAVDRYSTKRAALRYKAGGAWRDVTHQQLARRVLHTALGLRDLGLAPGDRVAILSGNRPEWAIADYGCQLAGLVDVPLYPTLPPTHVHYILRDSGAAAVFVSGPDQHRKVLEVQQDLPGLRWVIPFDDPAAADGVMLFPRLLQMGAAAEPRHPSFLADGLAADPDAIATLIYTSGTTGDPKGVMLSHRNFCSNVVAALSVLPIGPDDACLSFLPLSHSFERMAGHYAMFHAGATINYAQSMDTVSADLLEVRPTVVLAVPRLYEKMYARVLDAALSGGAVRRRVFLWARRSAEHWAETVLARRAVPASLAFQRRLADRLVFRRLRRRTGGRIRFFVSGGAPLAPEIAKFFYAAGLPILEGYGLTETSPVIAVNSLEAPRIGTVGRPIPEVEVRIADDGEILVRGPNVMHGYYNLPDATREALDGEGWLHTGDIGDLDPDGYLRITDRKKDLIKTAGGKYVAPQPIENLVKTSKFVLNAVVLGDRRKFPIILVVPDVDALRNWALQRHLPFADPGTALQQPDVAAKLEREVRLKLRDLARYEMPKKVLVVERDFTVESGELTPTLKVKRRVVEDHYREMIDRVYQEAEREPGDAEPEAASAD